MSVRSFLKLRCLNTLVIVLTASSLCGCMSVDGSSKLPLTGDSNPGNSAVTAPPGQLDDDKHLVHIPKDAEREAGLSVEEAQDRKLDICVDVTGEVLANANTTTHVTTPVTGRITQILGRIGDHVSEGKPLLIVRSTDIEQVESDMLQNMQQVRSDLKQALVQIDCDT